MKLIEINRTVTMTIQLSVADLANIRDLHHDLKTNDDNLSKFYEETGINSDQYDTMFKLFEIMSG